MSVSLFSKSKKKLDDDAIAEPQPSAKRAQKASNSVSKPLSEVAPPAAAAAPPIAMRKRWEDLALAPWVQKVCADLRYKAPTPIQTATIPLILEGAPFLVLSNLITFGQARTSWAAQRPAVVRQLRSAFRFCTNWLSIP